MSKRYEMRFAGSGGQGVILASVIMAEAAVIAGLNTVQSQAYGPEARGGVSKAETVVSREKIWYSKVTRPNFLLALTQSALEKYVNDVRECGIIMQFYREEPYEQAQCHDLSDPFGKYSEGSLLFFRAFSRCYLQNGRKTLHHGRRERPVL